MADASFTAPEVNASLCEFSLRLPSFSFSFKFPSLVIDLTLLFPVFGFKLSCDPSKPIDVTAGLPPGGGRIAKFDYDYDSGDL